MRLTADQRAAIQLFAGDQMHTLLYGGSRSAKSFTICRTIFYRAAEEPKSRHLIVRFRLAHIRASLMVDTIPKMLSLCFPDLERSIEHKKSDGYYILPNKAEVWYAGVDDKERTEKILGQEYATIFLNECSQIPWLSRELLMTRLAQQTRLRLKAYYDENPPLKTHWSYKLFVEKIDPNTGRRLLNPHDFAAMQMNPMGNAENLPPDYLTKVLPGLSDRQRKRFEFGQFGDAGEGALWSGELLEQQRVEDDNDLPNMQRIVVAVDPSGASSADEAGRDEIGIVVAGLGQDGIAYVMEDLTMKGSPAEWGFVAVDAYARHGADRIIGEENYGGAMVKHVVESAAANYTPNAGLPAQPIRVNYSSVTATRGKVVRAEPISALYEQGKVRHLAGLDRLEDELLNFTAFGYMGDRSPNRADAAIWALSSLFPSVIKAATSSPNRSRGAPQVNVGFAAMKRRRMGR